MNDTRKLIVNLLKEEILKKYPSISNFCKEQGIHKSRFSEFANGKRDIKLSTFLIYLRKLQIKIGFESNFDGVKTWTNVSDQLSIDINVTKKDK